VGCRRPEPPALLGERKPGGTGCPKGGRWEGSRHGRPNPPRPPPPRFEIRCASPRVLWPRAYIAPAYITSVATPTARWRLVPPRAWAQRWLGACTALRRPRLTPPNGASLWPWRAGSRGRVGGQVAARNPRGQPRLRTQPPRAEPRRWSLLTLRLGHSMALSCTGSFPCCACSQPATRPLLR
jgi:hypothetical protein